MKKGVQMMQAKRRVRRSGQAFHGSPTGHANSVEHSTAAATAKVAPARLLLLGYPGSWLDGRIRWMLPLTAL